MKRFVCQGLTVHYGATLSLWNLSFSVDQGGLIGIIGPNGAGKSSFIQAAMGQIQPSSGKVLFWGHPLSHVAEKVTYMPQKGSIDWNFPITVFDVVLMGRYHKMRFWKRPRKADLLLAEEALEKVGMHHLKDKQIGELSGGQQKRVFFARALVQGGKIYFLDEPFQGVDLETETIIMLLLQELAEAGSTLFVVHHDLHTVKKYFSDLLLLNRSLIDFGPVEKVFTEKNLHLLYRKTPFLFEEADALSRGSQQGIYL